MASKIKVNNIQDTGSNDILTSDGSGNVTLNTTLGNFTSTGIDDNATSTAITINSSEQTTLTTTSDTPLILDGSHGTDCAIKMFGGYRANTFGRIRESAGEFLIEADPNNDSGGSTIRFRVDGSEAMRIDSSGNVLVGKTSTSSSVQGLQLNGTEGFCTFTRNSNPALLINRQSNDGDLVRFYQADALEGSISVSGSTVSYNGFTGTHWSRLSDNSKPTILKGTILESLDEMMDWYQVQFDVTDDEGNTRTEKQSYALGDGQSVGDVITYTYEGTDYQATIIEEGDIKHTKSKISDTVDAKNVYGVFVDWDNDDDTVNDMYVAQTGTFVVRLNSSVTTLNKGDLIQSNGDGTGKVQADDIIRASTVAKVLSTTKIETYSDGSYIVPCSLHC